VDGLSLPKLEFKALALILTVLWATIYIVSIGSSPWVICTCTLVIVGILIPRREPYFSKLQILKTLPPLMPVLRSEINSNDSSTMEIQVLFNRNIHLPVSYPEKFILDLPIPDKRAKHYDKMSFSVFTNSKFAEFIDEGLIDEIVLVTAETIRRLSIASKFDEILELYFVIRMFSSFSLHSVNEAAIKHPTDTLYDKGGSQIDIALLCAVVLSNLGYLTYINISLSKSVFLGVEMPFDSKEILFLDYEKHKLSILEFSNTHTNNSQKPEISIKFWLEKLPFAESISDEFVEICSFEGGLNA